MISKSEEELVFGLNIFLTWDGKIDFFSSVSNYCNLAFINKVLSLIYFLVILFIYLSKNII